MHLISILFHYLLICTTLLLSLSLAQEELFKINKLNLVWTKAQHSLGPSKLKDLKNDLIKHEADELNLKRMKAHNQDKDGILEATVRKKLLNIMTKYSLDRYFEDVNSGSAGSIKTDSSQAKQSKPTNEPIFRDSKLDKLWKKAEKAGFDQEQLMILHEEFQHQQDKLDEHYETLNMIEEEIERSVRESNKLDNSIEAPVDDDTPKKKSDKKKKAKSNKAESTGEKEARLEDNLQQNLMDKHSHIKKGYDELARKISSGAIDVDQPFQERRVNELWTMATQSNFSASELESLKEELTHYQTRIEKLKHFQNQLERHNIASKESKSYSEDDSEAKHLKKKVKELAKKVDKSDKSIEKKITRDEL